MMEEKFDMGMLERIIKLAIDVDAKFIGVLIQMDGFAKEEIIINPIENAYDKFQYYFKTYGFDLVHKHSDGIRIIGATFGDDFQMIQYELLGE